MLFDLSQEVKRVQVIDPSVVSQLDYALQKVVTNGTGSRARAVGRPVAGKTGTTDSNLSAWFVGYTPQLSTSVVMFRTEADGRTRKSMNGVGGLARGNGGSFPAAIWTAYMTKAVKGMPVEQFPTPPVQVPTSTPSPTLSSSGSPSPSGSPSRSGSPSPSTTASGSPTPTGSPTGTASPGAAPATPGAPLAPAGVPASAAGILAAGDRRLLGAAGAR